MPEKGSMTGVLPPDLTKGEQRGQWRLFDNHSIGNFMVYHERCETKLLLLFAHPKIENGFL